MMPRRSFLCRALLGAAGFAAMPEIITRVRRPSLWIADSEPCVALSIQMLARHCGLGDARIFACKQTAINCLRTGVNKPALLVTDYLGGHMRGDKFIRLARDASPNTRLILLSAVVGDLQRWIAVAGLDAPRPDAIVEKPNARELIAAFAQHHEHHLPRL
jgi:CheY-like chemotaxis protein